MSIILPVYNAEATLEACLDSACAQDGVNLELVCIDDGSQDSSASLLEARAACDPRIRLFRQDNAGAAAARNRALGEIRGAFFTLLDADDRLEPGYLAALMQAALQHGFKGAYLYGVAPLLYRNNPYYQAYNQQQEEPAPAVHKPQAKKNFFKSFFNSFSSEKMFNDNQA